MRQFSILCLAALCILLGAGHAAAADAILGPNMYALNMADPGAAPACVNRGGKVTTMGGDQVCVLPEGCAANFSGMLMTTAIMDPATPESKKACTDACGMISTSEAGQTFCSKPTKHGAMRTMTGGGRPREPTN